MAIIAFDCFTYVIILAVMTSPFPKRLWILSEAYVDKIQASHVLPTACHGLQEINKTTINPKINLRHVCDLFSLVMPVLDL